MCRNQLLRQRNVFLLGVLRCHALVDVFLPLAAFGLALKGSLALASHSRKGKEARRGKEEGEWGNHTLISNKPGFGVASISVFCAIFANA
jgi:hypothetical protein